MCLGGGGGGRWLEIRHSVCNGSEIQSSSNLMTFLYFCISDFCMSLRSTSVSAAVSKKYNVYPPLHASTKHFNSKLHVVWL